MTVTVANETPTTSPESRPLWTAIGRGARLRCPHCGKGHMFRSYLKVADYCDACGEQLNLHRADDFPPYLAIFLVGHLLVGLMLHLEMTYEIAPWVYVATMVPAAILLPLLILPSLKGAVVGLQWANRMHGFSIGRNPALAGEA
ncbi:MAG TPA: DUF983 domain-containing protein [Devosia sp.]|nr:DUF983 domain-containing protein [Devosia sp.]